MKIKLIKRALLWVWELIKSLFQFWIRSPSSNTIPVLRFMVKKLHAVPRFMERNVNLEKSESGFSEKLENIQQTYRKYGSDFDPKEVEDYKFLEKSLKDKLEILYFIIRKTRPDIIVETGVAAGYSTGYILQALDDNKKGKLYSIDLPFQWYTYGENSELHLDSLPPGKLPGYIVPEKLKTKKRWKLIMGNTYKKLPILVSNLKKIDIFIHDSEHTYKTMMFEYKKVWPKITKKGFLLSDDIRFTNAFQDFVKTKNNPLINFKNLGITFKK